MLYVNTEYSYLLHYIPSLCDPLCFQWHFCDKFTIDTEPPKSPAYTHIGHVIWSGSYWIHSLTRRRFLALSDAFWWNGHYAQNMTWDDIYEGRRFTTGNAFWWNGPQYFSTLILFIFTPEELIISRIRKIIDIIG